MALKKITNVMKPMHKKFLDELRETGLINMFSSAGCLEQEFEIEHKEAREILLEWLKTYK